MTINIPETTRLPVNKLNPVAYNPRSITPEKFEALKANIIAEGFLEPVVVQKDGFKIIGGHQRVRAVKEICVEAGEAPPDLPCIVLDIDDVRAKKLNIKLNNLKGDFEPRMLGELLIDIYEGSTVSVDDAHELGFTEDEAKRYVRIVDPDVHVNTEDDHGPKSFGKNPTLSVQFPNARMRDQVKKLLAERSEFEEKMSGEIVADALGVKKSGTKKKPAKKKSRAA